MNLNIKRNIKAQDYTEGVLYIEGTPFCDTLELFDARLVSTDAASKIQNEKKKHKVCIPYGKYNVIVSYSPRFKKALPLLCSVPGFSGIRIHHGNTPKDSSGCILVGVKNGYGVLKDSVKTLDKLISLMGNNPCTITIE